MLENAIVRGKQIMGRLKALQNKYPVMGDVRGLGLMIAIEFRNSNRKPDADTMKAVLEACKRRNLLLLNCGTWNNNIRIIPPLNVKEEEVDKALTIMEEAFKEVTK
jgi:4-aminobutyrate aminotransferase-like enzyme